LTPAKISPFPKEKQIRLLVHYVIGDDFRRRETSDDWGGTLEQIRAWFDESVKYKGATVRLSDGRVYSGKINICDSSKLSDYIRNSDSQFLTMVSDSEEPLKIILLNKSAIVCVEGLE
jgi:hypothetical protein